MDRNDNENTTHTPENLVRTCLMLFLLSGRSSPIFENVSQNNVLEKSRKMKIFHILDSWSKSKTYWQNGQSLCHLICKSRNRFAMGVGGGDGGIILFTISVALNFSRGGCPNLYSPLNQGITCTWQTLTLLRCMVSISSIKLPLHLFQRFCQSIYTSYVVIHFNLYVPVIKQAVNYSSYRKYDSSFNLFQKSRIHDESQKTVHHVDIQSKSF